MDAPEALRGFVARLRGDLMDYCEKWEYWDDLQDIISTRLVKDLEKYHEAPSQEQGSRV
jgi:hypothetical protein